MLKIYKFDQDWYYGELFGIFIADDKDIEFLINSDIMFNAGEVLGKHSEVMAGVSTNDIIELSSNNDFIKSFIDNTSMISFGYNPLYICLDSYDMGEKLCPDCGIEWDDITVLEYIHLVRDFKLPDGYNLEDLDMNVITELVDFYKNEMKKWNIIE